MSNNDAKAGPTIPLLTTENSCLRKLPLLLINNGNYFGLGLNPTACLFRITY